ncbi:DUF2637 domain-containing protein [Rugosimonospora africana]|uniref:DUF2637 domain-containing protein n=1 Tax=Rugosimonospora africana TaxID=556532 RepID=UPI001944C542|nr:DUF2637 domain-containing protein [Rugosimonospora africana]
MTGQVTGATQTLHIPLLTAIPALAALELGGIVVLANADVRRRLGERAIASRLLSAAIASGAVTFNWAAHTNHLLGGFFAGMSALGYLVWHMHTENQRRDRLRITGNLPPTTPAYELIAHWLRHPMLTLRAKSLAKAEPTLGLYGSLATAGEQLRQQRRRRAIARVVHRKIRTAVDPATANIAVAVYDMAQIAARLADSADYGTLTALITADLAPTRLIGIADPQAVSHTSNQARFSPTGEDSRPIESVPGNDESDQPRPPHRPARALAVRPAASPTVPTRICRDSIYEPVSVQDSLMYSAWQQATAAGHEPSGADLARAAGRTNDATGVGRRAVRRYRQVHATATTAAGPGPIV